MTRSEVAKIVIEADAVFHAKRAIITAEYQENANLTEAILRADEREIALGALIDNLTARIAEITAERGRRIAVAFNAYTD